MNIEPLAREGEIGSREEEQEQMAYAVLRAPLVLDSYTREAEFAVDPPIEIPFWWRMQLRRVKVSSTRFPNDNEPYLKAEGFMRRLTTKGEPHKRDIGSWRPLPDRLVNELLGQASFLYREGD